MAGEIIRLGDPTTHGGKVVEGSPTDICHGKPIAFIGHQTYCPQCKGTFPIVEGAPTTTFYGKGVALAGMRTACGALLIATQMTDIVQLGGGAEQGSPGANDGGSQPKENHKQRGLSQLPTSGTAAADERELEQYFEAIDATGAPVDIVYRINAGTKKLAESTLPRSGATRAFLLDQETEIVFWKAP
jgi:uncharacterized Zn-binding protein involved in type VI secretion